MLWNALLIASGGTVRRTAAWGKPGTMNAWVLTRTSWTLCPPGRSVDGFTFRQSCAAPTCCFMRRTNLLVQVCQKYSVTVIQIFPCLLYIPFLLKPPSRWAHCLGLPLRPPVSLGTFALMWFRAPGFETCQCTHDCFWSSQAGRFRTTNGAEMLDWWACRGKSERWDAGGRSQVHGPRAAPGGIRACSRCFQVCEKIETCSLMLTF